MTVEKRGNDELKTGEGNAAFAIVRAESGSELCTDKLVPICEEYDR
jgi:hypothetical protein